MKYGLRQIVLNIITLFTSHSSKKCLELRNKREMDSFLLRRFCSNAAGSPTQDSKLPKDPTNEPQSTDKEYEEGIRKKILDSSLDYVKTHGWSTTTISSGAEALGYPGVIHGMFPRGGIELIEHFYRSSNQKLLQKMISKAKAVEGDSNKIVEKEFMYEAVEDRLKMILPYIEKWPEALALMSLPPNVPTSLANLLTLVDDICYYAGDRSVNMHWYGKRITLAGIYKATELYMLQDKSPEHKNTWSFLMRRMDDMSQINMFVAQSEQASQFAQDFATAAFTTARNILGLNWNR